MSDSVWPHRWQLTRLPHPWDSPGKNTGVGCHFLLQDIHYISTTCLFTTGSLYLFVLFNYTSPLQSPSLLATTRLFSARVRLFTLFCLFWFLDYTLKWGHMIFFFLCVIISLSIIPSKFIHVVANGKISFFSGWVIFCFVCIPHCFKIYLSTDGYLISFILSL